MLNRLAVGIIALVGCAANADAAQTYPPQNGVSVCDPANPLNCAAPNSSGQIPIAGSFSSSPPANVAPSDCSGSVTAGGTAQNAFAASATIHGFAIANTDPTTGSGEPLWFSMTTTAAAAAAASYPLSAPSATSYSGMGSFTTPYGLGVNHALSVIAATTGHKFSCTYW